MRGFEPIELLMEEAKTLALNHLDVSVNVISGKDIVLFDWWSIIDWN